MLSTDQKVAVLRKAGISVPAFPARTLTVPEDVRIPSDERGADAHYRAQEWKKTISALYLEYAAREPGRGESELEFTGR